MKNIFLISLLAVSQLFAASGDFLFTKVGTPNTPVLLTPVNGRVLYWNGTTLGNYDIATALAAKSDTSHNHTGTYQPLDSDLTSIAALSTTSYGRAFLTLADAAAGRTALSLGSAATLTAGSGSGEIPIRGTGGTITASSFIGDLTGNAATATSAAGLSSTLAVASGGTGTTNGSITGSGVLTLASASSNNIVLAAGSGAVTTVKNATPQLRIEDTDLTNIPSYSAVGFSPALTTSTVGQFGFSSSTGGGVDFAGFGTTAGGATGSALTFSAYSGKTSPTAAPIGFYAYKHNGTTGVAALASSEKVFEIFNNSTSVFSILGNGAATLPGTLAVTGITTATGGIVLPTETTTASASATGTKGTVCWDSSYIYVCTATNTWKRVAIATW